MTFQKRNLKGGFTLIELLVVVAIIGILAAVILASLGGARNKGADAKIKSQLGSMRNQSELYSGTGNAVNTVGPCPTTANTLFETGSNGLGTLFSGFSPTRCGSTAGQPSSGSTWALAVGMSSGAWCVDWTGTSRDRDASGVLYTGVGGATGAINGATYICR